MDGQTFDLMNNVQLLHLWRGQGEEKFCLEIFFSLSICSVMGALNRQRIRLCRSYVVTLVVEFKKMEEKKLFDFISKFGAGISQRSTIEHQVGARIFVCNSSEKLRKWLAVPL